MSAQKDIRHTPRLYVEADLIAGQAVNAAPEQAHYLANVLRMKPGEALRLFNGRDGEFLAHLTSADKKGASLAVEKNLRAQQAAPDLWLCAAPIKKAHFEYMIEKATELGAAAMQPVLTARTQIREVNTERAHSIAREAAEQSERLDIPEMREPVKLVELIASWPKGRVPIICAELGEAVSAEKAFAALQGKAKAAIITGPEGGFAAEEFEALRKLPGAVFMRLGPRILRADTAAIAALSLWQALCGDWK